MKIFLTIVFFGAWYGNLVTRADAGQDVTWTAVSGTVICLCGLYFSFRELQEWSE